MINNNEPPFVVIKKDDLIGLSRALVELSRTVMNGGWNKSMADLKKFADNCDEISKSVVDSIDNQEREFMELMSWRYNNTYSES